MSRPRRAARGNVTDVHRGSLGERRAAPAATTAAVAVLEAISAPAAATAAAVVPASSAAAAAADRSTADAAISADSKLTAQTMTTWEAAPILDAASAPAFAASVLRAGQTAATAKSVTSSAAREPAGSAATALQAATEAARSALSAVVISAASATARTARYDHAIGQTVSALAHVRRAAATSTVERTRDRRVAAAVKSPGQALRHAANEDHERFTRSDRNSGLH